MRRIEFVLLAFALCLIMGCGGESISEQLEQIDVLLTANKVDSAKTALDQIPLPSLKSKKDSAFLFLLKAEILHRKWAYDNYDSTINYSLEYYQKTSDKEKLARAYYYKGVISYELTNNLMPSIHLIKHAEEHAERTNNLLLKHKIYETLSYYSSLTYEYGLSLQYAKRAYQAAKNLNDKNRQAIALIYMAGDYSHFGKTDSVAICIQECLPLADYITDRDKAYLYTRIGEFYLDTEPELAEKYLKKAVDIHPQSWTYLALSNLYIKKGQIDKAQTVWKKALEIKGSTGVEVDVLKAMRQQSMEQHDFMQANALADSIIKTQKQFYEGQRNDQIAEIQAKYDKETAVRDVREKYMAWGLGLLALTTIIVTLLGQKSYQGMKTKKELAESKIRLDAYTKKAEELESSGKASVTEINKLHVKISELTHRHSGILAKGMELYDAIEAGGNTVSWTKDDFIDYLEYYKMRDLPFVNEMETDYNRLSPKYIFFAVLEHEGKSDDDILHIMGISESTLRSTRSRIKSKKKTIMD